MRYNEFNLNEEMINYNAAKGTWQVRSNSEPFRYMYERTTVLIQNVDVFVDEDAIEQGKRIYAYLRGDVVRNNPDLSDYTPFPIKYNKGDQDHPFINSESGKVVTNMDYALFDKSGVTGYVK
jgi:hypothetical protein